jgi:hypothetical protein
MSQTQGGGETQFRAMLRLGAEAAPVEPDERSGPKASFGGPATALSGKCGGPPEAAQARNQLVDVVQSWAEELFRLRAKPAGPQSEECRLDLGPPFHGRRKLRIWRWLGTLTQRACRLPHRARFPGGSYWRRAGRLIRGLRIKVLLARSSGGRSDRSSSCQNLCGPAKDIPAGFPWRRLSTKLLHCSEGRS